METNPQSDDLVEDDRWFARCAAWFQPTPMEVVGLAALLAGALFASVLLWWSASTRPEVLPSVATRVERTDGAPQLPRGEHTSPGEPVGVWPSDPDGRPPDAEGDATVSSDQLTVHVSGAVVHPGLLTLPSEARVGDAVSLAGGLRSDAAIEHVNLARALSDGEHIHVPQHGDRAPSGIAGTSGVTHDAEATQPSPSQPLNINRASAAQLQSLPGIGPAKARAILTHREEHGPFEVPGDLRRVTGIGERTFQSLAELVTVH